MIAHKIKIQELWITALLLIASVLLLWVSGALAAEKSQTDQADVLNKKVMVLYEKGAYAEAVPLAMQALNLRESMLGPKHPNVAVSLNNLGLLYASLEDFPKAEKLYLRALDILQAHLGSNHPHVAATLRNLETLYELMEEDKLDREAILMV
jgi:tetratricopeptide (TPR) repeat protein